MIERREASMSVKTMCEILDVSPSGYYASQKREPSQRQKADAWLGQEIERVFVASRRTYGSDRVHQQLRREGVRTSRKRVARLMQQHQLRSVRTHKRRWSLTRKGDHAYIVPNRLQQNFTATNRNQKWVTDTTYVPTLEGWLYLVSVMDLYSRQIVGWAMGEHHDATLATDALDMAIQRQQPGAGLIVHSDRGTEFANARFQQRAQAAHIQLSMSSTGNCYDNASAESVFATIKLEAVRDCVFATRHHAKHVLSDYIESFYNRQHLHSGIGYNCPVSFAA
jgi:putative transposase